jgi:hypothetical protein
MKVTIRFRHWGFFYGLPIYVGTVDGEPYGMVPLPVIPGTAWWISYIAPAIQRLQAYICGTFGIDSDANGHFLIDRMRPLRKPFDRVQDWPDYNEGSA